MGEGWSLWRGRGSRSVQELCVTFGPRDDHVHPDPHGLCGRRHHEVESVVGLDAEGEGGVGALEREEEAESGWRLRKGRERKAARRRVTFVALRRWS